MTTLRMTTSSVAAALMIRPVIVAARMPPATPVQSTVIDFVMVRAPNPPGSRQAISPPGAVFEIAPEKVLQGAVRLHGLTSSPTPDTQVLVACAWAAVAKAKVNARKAKALSVKRILSIVKSPSVLGSWISGWRLLAVSQVNSLGKRRGNWKCEAWPRCQARRIQAGSPLQALLR